MPELPEVERVANDLRGTILGKTFTEIIVRAPKSSIVISKSFRKRKYESLLSGRTVEQITRRGKNIIIQLDNSLTLWVHLKMTGQFRWVPKEEPIGKHDLFVYHLANEPKMSLRFSDYRRFGRHRLFSKDELSEQKGLTTLGPEPLEISRENFVALCLKRPRQIKAALLDQSFIAGVGNIYADESLWYSKIHPLRLTTSLSRAKLTELHSHIQAVLRKAISLMGTSVDSYAGVNGQPGEFQKYLAAYGNDGKPCNRCGAVIVRKKIGARSAHFCPRCQKQK